MSDTLSDSDTDLVSAISRCSKRLKTSSSSSTQSLPQYRSRTCGGASAAGSSFADQLCRRRRPVLRDIGFDKRLLPLTGNAAGCGGSDGGSSALQADLSLKLRKSSVTEAADGDNDDTDDEVIVIDRATFGQGRVPQVKHELATTTDQIKNEHSVNDAKKASTAGAHLVQRQSNSSSADECIARIKKSVPQAADIKVATGDYNNDSGEGRKKEAQIESLLLVLLDIWDTLAPIHRNTLINTYGAHYESLLLREDHPSSNALLHAGSNGDAESYDKDESTIELRENIASSRQCLAKQLCHARELFTSTLSNSQLLEYASSAERLIPWQYIVRVTMSRTRLFDLAQAESENFSGPFDDYEAAKHFLKGLIATQRETDKGCMCKHTAPDRPNRDVPFLERLKGKQRKTKIRKTECQIEKIKLLRYHYEVYEKRHCEGMFFYWYIDVEVGGGGPEHAETPGVHGILANRGDAVPKSKTAGLYVVTGQVYTATSTCPEALVTNAAGLAEGRSSGQRQAALSPAMQMSRLPESVWTTCKLANEAAYALISAHTKVNEFLRTDEDERAWRCLIRPAINREWERRGSRLVSSSSPVFECTLEIPDILRDRLGYDTIVVEVVCIKPTRPTPMKPNERNADAAGIDREQQDDQTSS